MKRKFEEMFEEKIEGRLEDDFKVELFNEDETELIAKSGEDFCQTHVKTEINDHGEVRENEDVKIEILEAEKIAKNVEHLGDAAFVKAKGTWYRARKCHKVKENFKGSGISLSHAAKTDSFAYGVY